MSTCALCTSVHYSRDIVAHHLFMTIVCNLLDEKSFSSAIDFLPG